MAALLRRQACSPSRCRSRQLYETFVFAPTNHFAKGGFHSRTFFHGVNQETCSRAICAQKRSGLFSPSLRSSATRCLPQLACLANSARGRKTRFSFSRDSMSGTAHLPRGQLPAARRASRVPERK